MAWHSHLHLQAGFYHSVCICACREAVIGLVLVKELVLIDMFANIPVSALSMRPIPHLRADTAMYDLLKLFQTGRTHMVLLTKPPPGAKLLAAQATGSANSRADLAVNIGPQTLKRVAEEVGHPIFMQGSGFRTYVQFLSFCSTLS